MTREALKMAKSLGLKGNEAAAFAKMQLQEAYGGNMTTREIDILMSGDYNNMLGHAGTKSGRSIKPPSPGTIAQSEGMVYKATEGKADIQMAEGLGKNVVGFQQTFKELAGTIAGSFDKTAKALDDNTAAIKQNKPALPDTLPVPITRFRQR